MYVGNLSYDVKYRDMIEFMRGGGWGRFSSWSLVFFWVVVAVVAAAAAAAAAVEAAPVRLRARSQVQVRGGWVWVWPMSCGVH